MERFDAAVVGAGAVGMSTAYHLSQEGLRVAVIEKELEPAVHQSGRNSGVIHAGYNPKPGTKKAEYCVSGNRELKDYCYERGVPVNEGGILLIARREEEMPVLDELYERGNANGTDVRMVGGDEIPDIEPYAVGVAGLLAGEGASVDAKGYVHALANDAVVNRTDIFYGRQVHSITENEDSVNIRTDKDTFEARALISAAGLYADSLAGELARDLLVVPFRGYYAELRQDVTHMVNSHIYAAPDLDFPFLGVHLSKKTDGRVIVGPGAMLAFGREAYSFGSLKGGKLIDTLSWPGFYKMISRPEFRSLIRSEVKKSLLVKEVGKEAMMLVPGLRHDDFIRSYAGNRAQLIDREGNLVDDIVVRETERTIHVLNVISPGLTCSLPFGRDLAGRVIEKLQNTTA